MNHPARPRTSLLWKMSGVNLLVVASVILLVWLAVDYLAAGYFTILMEKYDISPKSSHRMFVDSVHRYLLWASLASVVLAVGLNALLTRRILRPLMQMSAVTRRIADGDYSAKVPVRSHDEVGMLAEAFNSMVDSLERVEKLRRSLMINVAHELRTPFTNIQGYIEAMLDGVLPPTTENLTILLEETTRLVSLAEDVLEMARSDYAANHLRTEAVSMEECVKKSLQPFLTKFEDKGIDVEVKPAAGVDLVEADADKLSQILHNLIQNALDYTDAGGSAAVASELEGDRVRTVVANTGREIDQSDLPFIFERFYRGEKSRSREHGGAGLGLAIVKELVEAHGGRVGAEIDDGRTRIWFTLPRPNEASDAGPAAQDKIPR